MDKEIIDVLKDFGFEEREIKTYLTLIKFGSLPALKIARETRIDRTTVYDILEKLIDKGIVFFIIKNKTKIFSALHPEKLLIYFKEKYNSLENIIPKLNVISKSEKEKTRFEIFQGKEGIKSVLKDLINSKSHYYVIGIKKEYEDLLSYFNEHAILKLNKLEIKEIAIVSRKEKFKKLKHGKYKYLDEGLLSPITTLIYQNKVIFFIWTDPYYAILIQNNTFTQGYKEYFSLLWNIAKN